MKRFIIALLIGLVSAGVTFADPHKNESGKGHGKHDKHRDKWEEKNWKEANKFEDKARERSEKALKEQRKEAEKFWKEQEKWNARNAPLFIPQYDLPQAAPPEIYNWPGIEPAYQQYGPPMPPAPPVVEYFYPSDYRQYPNRGAETGARLGAKIGWMLGGAQGAALGADIGHEIGLEVPDR